MVRDNNVDGLGTSSNYYICHVEHTAPSMLFDLVAAHWPSTAASRKNPHRRSAAAIELKVLDGSLGEDAGLASTCGTSALSSTTLTSGYSENRLEEQML